MSESYAILLPEEVIAQIKHLGTAVRNREVAALVGAGISQRRGMPGWGELVRRLILAWKEYDLSPVAQRLSADNYVRLWRSTFSGDLDLVSYLRRRASNAETPSFGELLYSALYTSPSGRDFAPEPDYVHRHLVALFRHHPNRIWTTNYDDLLERAAYLNSQECKPLDPVRHRATGELLIAHLHGFVPPRPRAEGHPDPREASVILAEDDYHAIATDVAGWTNREFFRLFDDHRALILGMSLGDPNVRRVLMARAQSLRSGSHRQTAEPEHFAVLPTVLEQDLGLTGVHTPTRSLGATYSNETLTQFWRQHGIEIIGIPQHESVLPFLTRLRYESYGARPGDLWKKGSELGYLAVEPWRDDRQQVARNYLGSAMAALAEEFGIRDGAEMIDMGLFLLKPDGRTLELTFRAANVSYGRGRREFSVDPDAPTGLAGRVFVSGDLVRIPRTHPLHNYGLGDSGKSSSASYEGIVAVPVVDWQNGGVPLGVIYLTTSRTDGRIFSLPAGIVAQEGERSLDDLYIWMSDVATTLLLSWRQRDRR